jgi:hypothetical protein
MKVVPNYKDPVLLSGTKYKSLLIIFTTIVLFTLSLVFSSSSQLFAGDCPDGYCEASGEYECQGGTMCCTGGGCPTYCYHACCWDDSCYNPSGCDCGTCRSCPDCDDEDPDEVTLRSPANGSEVTSNPVTLDWDLISGWGNNCGDDDCEQYKLYINGSQVGGNFGSTSQYTFNGTWGQTYTWKVVTDNCAESTDSETWSFYMGSRTRVIGRVWEDLNGNGVYDQSNTGETWSGSSVSCSIFRNDNITIFSPAGGADIFNTWECNPNAYYTTDYLPIAGPSTQLQSVQLQLRTPEAGRWPTSYVNWRFDRCTTLSTCSPVATTTGSNSNIANIQISAVNGRDWTNHLHWQLVRNYPPTATIVANIDPTHTYIHSSGQPIHVVPANEGSSYTANATDNRASRPWRTSIARRPIDPVTRVAPTDAASYTVLGTNAACSGTSCSATFSNNAPVGYSIYYPVVEDEVASNDTDAATQFSRCNGHPGVNSGVVTGWADCDPAWGNGYQDEAIVFGDRRPVCDGISGPTYLFAYPDPSTYPYVYPESIGFFNLRAHDDDNNEIKHVWSPSWTNPSGLLPTISRITVYAAGTMSNGVGPQMQLWLGDNTNGGDRGVQPERQVLVSHIYNPALPTYQEYGFNGPFNNVSSIDIGFPNDATLNGDRNLFIERIVIDYEIRPGSIVQRTLYPYSEANTGNVFYDRGASVGVPYNNHPTWFDGIDIATVTQAGGSFGGVAPGTMAWSGTLSFPIPIRASTSGGSQALYATPTGTLPYYDGNSCAAYNITTDLNPTYTVNGTIYLRDQTLTCPVQNISTNEKVTSTGVILTDENGVPIPGLATTTDPVTGAYSISGVPVHFRPDPFCPNCGAKVCVDQMDPDVGVYLAACSQMQPPVSNLSGPWGDAALCSSEITTNPQITVNTVATVNLGLDYYQNEKWSAVLDGDVYTPGITFDVAVVPGTNFLPYFINRRIDSGANRTIGGFTFIDDANVDLGLPLDEDNLSEYGGYARALRNISNTYDFKDKWLQTYTPVAPTHDQVTSADPRNVNHYAFDSNQVYVYTLDQFNNWYNDAAYSRYDITGSRSTSIIYVTGDHLTETLHLGRAVRTSSETEMLVLVTNLPIEIPDTLEIPETQLSGALYNVNSLSVGSGPNLLPGGYLDFVIISSQDIEFDSRYDDTVDPTVRDLPIMVHGALISKASVLLNRDLWHIYNSDYPAEMVRYYSRLVPEIMRSEYDNEDIPSFSGFGVFDIQTVYE